MSHDRSSTEVSKDDAAVTQPVAPSALAAAAPAASLAAEMTLTQIYTRSLALLSSEKYLALTLAAAGVFIAGVQLAEPILFGRVVDALTGIRKYGYRLGPEMRRSWCLFVGRSRLF